VQPDGKVLIGGGFTTINGTNRNGVARLNTDGSLDSTFVAGISPFGNSIYSIAAEPDGKVLIGGEFSSVDQVYRYGIVRLKANGELDSSFHHVFAINGSLVDVRTIVLQPDGKVIIGGYFQYVHGTRRDGLARLNPDGSLDMSFVPGTDYGAGPIVLQLDGRMFVGGNGVLRLNADGSLDSNFARTRADHSVRCIAFQPDGNLLIGGGFTTVNGMVRPRVARLYGDTAVPSLKLVRSNSFAVLSWPVAFGNFQLQETTNLSLPNPWLPVALPTVTNGSQISVTVPTTVGSRFFRLSSQ